MIALDIRSARRSLLRSRAYAVGVVAALAIAIAGTALVFAVFQAVLLKPLPFSDPDRLVWVWATRTDRDKAFFSIADYEDYRRATTTLQNVAAYASWGVNLTGRGDPERLQGAKVTASAFSILGVSAALGRPLIASDDAAGADPIVVISDALWRGRFGGAPGTVGSRVQLNGEDYEIAGVLPKDFLFPGLEAELYAPIAMERDPRRTDRGTNFLRVFGRLHPQTTVAQVRDEWGRIARELRDAYPEANAKKTEPRVLPLEEEMLGMHRPALRLVMGAVLAVWILACTNILNLQLIRLGARERQGAIRSALGASPLGVSRPHLLENMALVGVGGVLGVVVAATALPVLVAAVPVSLPRASEIRIDVAVATFTFAVIGATALLVAVLPMMAFARRRNLVSILRSTASSAGISPAKNRARNALVVFEIAAALCLMLSTALLLDSYHRLQSIDPGVRLEGVVQTRVSLPAARYPTQQALERFLTLTTQELLRVPGVTRVAAANALPLSAQNIRTDFTIVGVPAAPTEIPGAQNRWVTPGYFETLGVRLVEGRTFTDADATARASVAIVDEALASRFWPGKSAVGSQIRLGGGTFDVVGVVGDVTHFDVGESPLGTLYGTVQQLPPSARGFFAGSFMIAINGATESDETRRAVVGAIRRVDPDVPTAAPWSMGDQLRRVLAARQFVAVTLAIFAVAALLLAVSGVYAVVSATAREQTRELAIRLALGASPGAMVNAVLGLAGRLLAVGIPLGLALAALALQFVLSDAGVRSNDWPMWVVAPLVISLAAVAASYVRARRVLVLDPALTLRSE